MNQADLARLCDVARVGGRLALATLGVGLCLVAVRPAVRRIGQRGKRPR